MITPKRLLRLSVMTLAILPALFVAQSNNDARSGLYRYIDSIAHTHLTARTQGVAQIRTRAEAERRKSAVRDKILHLIGGLPERRGPVQVKEFGSISADGFRVEKIAYESLPGFWVTSDLYVPASGNGPFPAIVVAPGHGAAGKTENWSWGGNLARNGIIALAYDPIGQGERLQYYDGDKKASFIGNPTGEHGEANIGPMLIGEDIARYMVNDAMRGVDYLIGRKDVDGARIGAFGCSGGGTMTAYFAALDDRVKAAATACYMTTFEELLASPQGAQDAEQSIPHFIEQGMDFADWVEVFAPKPYAIVSTQDDMFPFAGARQTHDEALRIYGLYNAADRLQWITGPGGHGNLGPISPQILAFFTNSLNGSEPAAAFTALRLQRREDLQVTPTGQVVTSIPGETVHSLNRKRADALLSPAKPLTGKSDVQKLQTRVRQDIHNLAGVSVSPGAAHPVVEVVQTTQHDGYRTETISLKSDGETVVSGRIAIPAASGVKHAVLMMDAQPNEGEIDRLAKMNRIVLALEPRPTPPGTESIKSPYLGVYNLLSLRAFLVGKTIVGLRTDDAIRAVDWLAARNDVDPASITAYGNGPMGMVVIHAAALDSRISRVVVENTLTTYRMIVDQPVHRNVSEVVIPGVLRHYDTPDLLEAIYPRPVVFIAPRDAMGELVSEQDFGKAMMYVMRSDENLSAAKRVRFQAVRSGAPLPLD